MEAIRLIRNCAKYVYDNPEVSCRLCLNWGLSISACSLRTQTCRISSNYSRRRLLFSHKKGAIIRGKRLFQTLFTESHALNILFYFSIKSKNWSHQINWTRAFFSAPNLVPWLLLSVNIFESFCRVFPHQTDSTSTLQGGEKRKRRWREGWGGGGDYSREAIILNISV